MTSIDEIATIGDTLGVLKVHGNPERLAQIIELYTSLPDPLPPCGPVEPLLDFEKICPIPEVPQGLLRGRESAGGFWGCQGLSSNGRTRLDNHILLMEVGLERGTGTPVVCALAAQYPSLTFQYTYLCLHLGGGPPPAGYISCTLGRRAVREVLSPKEAESRIDAWCGAGTTAKYQAAFAAFDDWARKNPAARGRREVRG